MIHQVCLPAGDIKPAADNLCKQYTQTLKVFVIGERLHEQVTIKNKSPNMQLTSAWNGKHFQFMTKPTKMCGQSEDWSASASAQI